MKKLSSMMMIALAALAFQACKSKTSSSTTDSTSVTKDSTVKDTTMKTGSATTIDKGDSTFVVTAASDGMAEVNAGKLAQQKASGTRVKNFATMMVTDHSKAGSELAALAKTKNIALPSTPSAEQQKMADDMNKMSGKDFDKDYVAGMVEGHEKAVKLFTDASNNCKDPDIKAFAIKTLPTLKMHLDSINAIKASMK